MSLGYLYENFVNVLSLSGAGLKVVKVWILFEEFLNFFFTYCAFVLQVYFVAKHENWHKLWVLGQRLFKEL